MRQNQPGRLHDIFPGGLAIPTPCGDGLDGFQHDDIRSVPVHFRFNSKFDNGAHDIFRNSDAPEFPSGGDNPFGYLIFPFLPCGTEAHRIIFKGRTARHHLKPRFRFRHTPDLHAQPEPVEKLRAEFPFCERLGTADEETLSLTANRQVRKLERGLGVLELITTIAPILGLTGTVTGMISTFQAIGEHGSRVDPSVLAGGIWEALITTAAGLLVALPAHVAYHFLENRLSELIQTVQEIVDVRRIAFCEISHGN